MQLPPEPKRGYVIAEWVSQLLRWLRLDRITAVRGGRIEETPNGRIIVVDQVDIPKNYKTLLPFTIYVSPTTLNFTEGIFCEETITPIAETDPAEGLWHLQGVLTIDDTTGVKVSATVEWTQTEGVDSSTVFYTTIGTAYVNAGTPPTPDPGNISQLQYGTIVGIIHGGISDVWDVTFF